MERIQENDMGIGLNGEAAVPCSICLDLVTYTAERSMAKLQCGHQFHLDCIGSAFNMKGMMQCPNCRKIEQGQWLYASGSTYSFPDLPMDGGTTDSHPFFFSFTEMPYGVHICPFRGVTQVHPSLESSLGMMSSTISTMVNHQNLQHGWVQYHHHSPFQHQHPLSSTLPVPAGRFDTHQSMPRFIPPGPGLGVYEPSTTFSTYVENPSVYYSHPWIRDDVSHFPLP